MVMDYFSSMFRAGEVDLSHMQPVVALVQPKVTPEMNSMLCAPYTATEIRVALFQMYPTKAPRSDGMPPLFFQRYWDTIGSDVVGVVQSFLHSGQLLSSINYTHVIANRLKGILSQISSSFQSAFIPGRLISDNNLIANEVSHLIHNNRSSSDGVMSLKLDMSKAYDLMEWVFLEAVLFRLGFDESWIHVIMQCVKSVRYSFLINGQPRGYLAPTRGLRQDDSLLFGKANLEECSHIQDVLLDYELASGQKVNFSKSSIVFSKKERLNKKLEGWQGKLLSSAGKDLLIRAGEMGFRDLHAYNLALLSKQGWRLIHNPGSLLARLYQARYFPNGDFWSSELSSSPSACWRGIHAAKHILRRGVRWQVGNGQSVGIWEDPWIPRPSTFLSIIRHVDGPETVADLLLPGFTWNQVLINQYFAPEDVDLILSMSRSQRDVPDRLIWHYDKRGRFSTKSAYALAFSELRDSGVATSNPVNISSFLKQIWFAQISGKDESINHITRDCQFVKDLLSFFLELHGVLHIDCNEGVVICDALGDIVGGACIKVNSVASPEAIEAMACRAACSLAVQ
ncbi:uncharacterized protein LOC112193983 [Rosa chinensis]|uniref:uncharacterized protein LOC112193983 n=1 Tax=Rosa chinensis TaxID=74649 RepID=UPI000D08C6A5|nr:uncharacterized protein LOC112193983 [Rosa chinensis]